MAKGQAYSWLTSQLMKVRSNELKKLKASQEQFRPLIGDRADAQLVALIHNTNALLNPENKPLDDVINEQERLLQEKHHDELQTYIRAIEDIKKAEDDVRDLTEQESFAETALKEAQEAKAASQAKFKEAFEQLPEEGKGKVDELKTKAAQLTTLRTGAGARKANREKQKEYKDLVDNPAFGLGDLAPHMEEVNTRDAAENEAQSSLQQIKTELANKNATIKQKQQEATGVKDANQAVAKLALLQVLSTATSQAGTSTQATDTEVEDFKRNSKALGVSDGTGLVNTVKEFFNTAYNVLPIPSRKAKPATTTASPTTKDPDAPRPADDPKTGEGDPEETGEGHPKTGEGDDTGGGHPKTGEGDDTGGGHPKETGEGDPKTGGGDDTGGGHPKETGEGDPKTGGGDDTGGGHPKETGEGDPKTGGGDDTGGGHLKETGEGDPKTGGGDDTGGGHPKETGGDNTGEGHRDTEVDDLTSEDSNASQLLADEDKSTQPKKKPQPKKKRS